MEKVLIAGGTGLLGSYLAKLLSDEGFQVGILSRNSKITTPRYGKIYYWNPDTNEIDPTALTHVNYIINLAGENIAEKRWTTKRKHELLDSRLKSTNFLFNLTKIHNLSLKAFVTASAIGYYGTENSESICQESDSVGTDFLADVTNQWEQAASQFQMLNIRTVKLRTGIVLSEKGGALSKMIFPFKLGFAPSIGSGKHYFPWIHIADMCHIYLKAITDDNMVGVYNAVAPTFTTNLEFTKILAGVLHKHYLLFHVPAFVFKIVFGELSQTLVNGSKISYKKIESAGFQFQFSHLQDALKNLLVRKD
ncbi:MAG TPA: TIGR01777 family oxidoreductase [Paludibacteraceae bacterium]|nr:TIGR01777 family oxidoreductase [Paludibacteraceae bacterium]